MGSFTNRSTKWEVLNSWWLLIEVFGMGMLNFVGLLYAGLMGNKNKWIGAGILSFIINIVLFVFTLSSTSSIPAFILIANWGISLGYSFMINREFLQRLDAIGRGITVPRDRRYLGSVVIPKEITDVVGTNNFPDSVSTTGLQFIADLQKWEAAIEPAKLKNDIAQLRKISGQIVNKTGTDSNDFFIRYADSVNKLLAKYDEIENAKLNTIEATTTLQEVESFIEKMVVVFEKEFTNLYKKDLLDINTDVEAFTQSLKNRGLLDEEPEPLSTKNTQ